MFPRLTQFTSHNKTLAIILLPPESNLFMTYTESTLNLILVIRTYVIIFLIYSKDKKEKQ